jgi:hypothetical protein
VKDYKTSSCFLHHMHGLFNGISGRVILSLSHLSP